MIKYKYIMLYKLLNTCVFIIKQHVIKFWKKKHDMDSHQESSS